MDIKISSPFTPDSFYRKMDNLGITRENYEKRQQDLPCVRIHDIDRGTAQEWCETNLGDNWIWSSPTQTDYTDFYFATDEDAVIFKLKFNTY